MCIHCITIYKIKTITTIKKYTIMKTTISYKFETKANVSKISFCAYTIKFFSYSDAKEFHKLVCESNTFRNCFSHIDGVTVNIETDINVSISSNNDILSISVVND